MAVIVRVWLDGDADSDAPLLDLSGESDSVADSVKLAAAGEESTVLLRALCRVAGDIVAQYNRKLADTVTRDDQITKLQAQIDELEALKEVTVDQDIIDAVKATPVK